VEGSDDLTRDTWVKADALTKELIFSRDWSGIILAMPVDREANDLSVLAETLKVSLSTLEAEAEVAAILQPLDESAKKIFLKRVRGIEAEKGNKAVLADNSFSALLARVNALKLRFGEIPKTPEEKYAEEYDLAIDELEEQLEEEQSMVDITFVVFLKLARRTILVVNRKLLKSNKLSDDEAKALFKVHRPKLDALRARFVVEKAKTPAIPKAKAAEVAHKIPEKLTIDIATWPEADHPQKFQDLKALLKKKSSEVAAADLSISESQLRRLIFEIKEQIRVVTEDVLDPGQVVDSEYENASEVKRFLRQQYLEVDPLNPTRQTADVVIATFETKIEDLKKEVVRSQNEAEEKALEARIDAVYTDPKYVQLEKIKQELDPKHPIDKTNIADITTRLQELWNDSEFLKSLDVDPDFQLLEPAIKQHFGLLKQRASARIKELQKAFIEYQVVEIAKIPSSISEFADLQTAISAFEVYVVPPKPAPDDTQALLNTMLKEWKRAQNFTVNLIRFGTTPVQLTIENVRLYEIELEKIRQRVDLLTGQTNHELIEAIDQILNPTTPLEHRKFSQVRNLQKQIRYQKLKALSNSTLTAELDAKAEVAIKNIKQVVDIVGIREAMSMPWENLIDEIRTRNLNIWDHEKYTSLLEEAGRAKELYDAFQARKTGSAEETSEQKQLRIDSVVGLQIHTMQNILQYEGQKASTERGKLMEEMLKKNLNRDELLKATKYHPVYGAFMEEILNYIITETTDNKSEISYAVQASSRGRATLEKHIQSQFESTLKVSFYMTLDSEGKQQLSLTETPGLVEDADRKQYLIDNLFSLIFKTYYAFNLIDVGFAELQSGTRTKQHDPRTKTDYTFLTRPDAALVHRAWRYNRLSDWSLNTLTTLKRIPAHYGRRSAANAVDFQSTRKQMDEIRHGLQLRAKAYYDIDSFTGKNGVEPSSLFNPWFPNTNSFLSLGSGERLEFENEIWGLDANGDYVNLGLASNVLKQNVTETGEYQQAEAGWKLILETELGGLPESIDDHMILETNGMDGAEPKPGLIDDWFKNGAGLGKLFQDGEYLRQFIAPWLTHYIFRIFARYSATGEYRNATFRDLIRKIDGFINGEGGAAIYRKELMEVVRNISHPRFANAQEVIDFCKHDDSARIGRLMSTNLLQAPRREERKAWLKEHYRDKGWVVPSSRPLIDTGTADFLRAIAFYDKMNGVGSDPGLPENEVGRLGDFSSIIDAAGKAH